MKRNQNGDTLLHEIVRSKCASRSMVVDFLSLLSTKEVTALLQARDSSGRLPFMVAWSRELTEFLLWLNHGHIDIYLFQKKPVVILSYVTEARPGAKEEVAPLQAVLQRLGFPVIVLCNPSKRQLLNVIDQQCSDKDISGLFLFTMSHGKDGYLILCKESYSDEYANVENPDAETRSQSEENRLSVTEILIKLDCFNLQNKPKVC